MEQQLRREAALASALPRQAGLTLVEVMVSLAISLVILSALVYIYVASRGAYRTNEAVARVQENGRFAIELLVREIREAGYLGCLSRGIPVTDIRKANPTPVDWASTAIRGFENGNAWISPTGITRRSGTDVLRYSGLVGNPSRVLDRDGDPVNANIKVDQAPPDLRKGESFIVTNCERATIANAVDSDNSKKVVVHSGGANEIGEFKINPIYTLDSRALLFSFDQVDFFIGRASASLPWSLYRYSLAKDTSEALVENVEDMDVTFGVDTNGDGSADAYQNSDTVTAGNNWPNVVSVRVALLVRSPDNGSVVQPQSVYFRATSGAPDIVPAASDRYLRQTFNTTIALRNRLP